MKIAYLAYVRDAGREGGAVKKLRRQAREWLSRGHEVHLFLFSPSQVLWQGFSGIPITLEGGARLRSLLQKTKRLANSILEWDPDVMYLRFGTYYPSFGRLFCRVPTVLEINTYDLSEYTLTLSRPQYLYHCLFRSHLLRSAAGHVFVARELEEKYAQFGRPGRVVANGIDLSSFDPAPPVTNGGIRVVFLGTSRHYWHGIEELCRFAAATLEWRFDVVGYEPGEIGNVSDNVTCHGVCTRTQYRSLLEQASVAIGSLGLYKNHMNEASPLKVREYLASGLPVVLAHDDTDFDGDEPFLLRVPNRPGGLSESADRVREFVQNWKGRRVSRDDIQHIDIRVKEQERLEFLAKIVAEQGSRR